MIYAVVPTIVVLLISHKVVADHFGDSNRVGGDLNSRKHQGDLVCTKFLTRIPLLYLLKILPYLQLLHFSYD
jgi:hypothetical protein